MIDLYTAQIVIEVIIKGNIFWQKIIKKSKKLNVIKFTQINSKKELTAGLDQENQMKLNRLQANNLKGYSLKLYPFKLYRFQKIIHII